MLAPFWASFWIDFRIKNGYEEERGHSENSSFILEKQSFLLLGGFLIAKKTKKKETQKQDTFRTELGAVLEGIWVPKVVQKSIKTRSDFRLDF
jgi:hypothetical protein